MRTEVLRITETTLTSAIERACEVLHGGGLVAFPTETVYGLGAHALDATAVRRIFAAKGRPTHNPLIVHVATGETAQSLAASWSEVAEALSQRFWPGPLTLVVSRATTVPDEVTAGGSTVALRIPAHPVAQALLRAAQIPVAAPSANRSGNVSPTRAEHVLASLDGRIDLILDAGSVPGGIESTVLDLTTTPIRLLRPGLLDLGVLEDVVGPIDRPNDTAPGPLRSPGQLTRHYAPRAHLECWETEGRHRAFSLAAEGHSVGWLTLGPDPHVMPPLVPVCMPHTPAGYARHLYEILHHLDALGVEHIIVDMPPDLPEWLGVRDRLRRASASIDPSESA